MENLQFNVGSERQINVTERIQCLDSTAAYIRVMELCAVDYYTVSFQNFYIINIKFDQESNLVLLLPTVERFAIELLNYQYNINNKNNKV